MTCLKMHTFSRLIAFCTLAAILGNSTLAFAEDVTAAQPEPAAETEPAAEAEANEPEQLAEEQSIEAQEAAQDQDQQDAPLDIFDAIDEGIVDVKFVARSSTKGRLVFTNNTKKPVDILIPEAFAGVPVAFQRGGGFGGGGGGLGGGGGQQNVGGGGGGRGGGRGGGGGRRGGAFSVAPEKVGRLDVPLLCLDHGLRDPSSSKPYEIRPIEDVVDSPALIEIIKAYANGDLPFGASQAAAWHINSEVSWADLASKLTGTVRSIIREPYFSGEEIRSAMAIVHRAEVLTDGQIVKRRNWRPAQADETTPTAISIEEGYEEKEVDTIDTQAELSLEATEETSLAE